MTEGGRRGLFEQSMGPDAKAEMARLEQFGEIGPSRTRQRKSPVKSKLDWRQNVSRSQELGLEDQADAAACAGPLGRTTE